MKSRVVYLRMERIFFEIFYVGGKCQEFDFYEVEKNIIIFQKEKGNTFTLLIILYTVKSSKISKIAQIYTYDPQSAVINVQSPPK